MISWSGSATLVTGIEIVPSGSFTAPGGSDGGGGVAAAAITGVALDVEPAAPLLLEAWTWTRIRWLTSAPVRRYVVLVAPLRLRQLLPFWSQRSHWMLSVIGCVPAQVPGLAVSVAPCCGVPEMVGFTVATGLPATTAVGSELAWAVPAEFFAVTSKRTRRPTSEPVRT